MTLGEPRAYGSKIRIVLNQAQRAFTRLLALGDGRGGIFDANLPAEFLPYGQLRSVTAVHRVEFLLDRIAALLGLLFLGPALLDSESSKLVRECGTFLGSEILEAVKVAGHLDERHASARACA